MDFRPIVPQYLFKNLLCGATRLCFRHSVQRLASQVQVQATLGGHRTQPISARLLDVLAHQSGICTGRTAVNQCQQLIESLERV